MSGNQQSTETSAAEPGAIDASTVADYLENHPAFFREYPELLTAMELPHGGSGAVSLVERQVNLLREQNTEIQGRLSKMTSSAQSNDALFESTRQVVVALLEREPSESIEHFVTRQFQDVFGVEDATLVRFEDASVQADPARLEKLKSLVRRPVPFCGVLRAEDMQALFPARSTDHSAEGSVAIAPLIRDGECQGIIGVGSSDTGYYDAAIGTVFLEHLAEVIVRLPLES